MILKLSFVKHFQKAWILIFYCLLILFILWVLNYSTISFVFAIVLVILLVVPTLAVHLNHYKYSEGLTVILLDNMVKVEGRNKDWDVLVDDIRCITIFMSNARAVNIGFQAFAFESYFYCKIDTKFDESFYLSCLFSDRLDGLLKDKYQVPFVIENKYYPLIN